MAFVLPIHHGGPPFKFESRELKLVLDPFNHSLLPGQPIHLFKVLAAASVPFVEGRIHENFVVTPVVIIDIRETILEYAISLYASSQGITPNGDLIAPMDALIDNKTNATYFGHEFTDPRTSKP